VSATRDPATDQTNPLDPNQVRQAPGAESPRSTGRLLSIVRKLIDYGRQLVSTLRQPTAPTDLPDIARNFGTGDIAQIVARIMRGLLRATALEARLAHRRNPPPSGPTARTARKPRAARPVRHHAIAAEPLLADLPSADEIAAEIRHRPVGAVIADICRDLGIPLSHTLWRELTLAIVANGGRYTALLDERIKRIGTFSIDRPATELLANLPPHLQFVLTPGTGPP
jgi:hypothetical protein